ncbi:MAG: rhodanese-like domain-containing protein [Bryobacteraceae bacterium]
MEFLLRYGYIVLFGTVLAEQIGLPIPSAPVILAVGALAGVGKFSLWGALAVVLVAAVAGDATWYQLGRSRGAAVLRLLCRISLEPDSCVRTTRIRFEKLGSFALVIAKFVPGLSTAAPPMAGVTRMPLGNFLLADSAGSLVWGAAFLAAGYLFGEQLEHAAASAARWGGWFLAIASGLLALYIGWKYYRRRRFLHHLRGARVQPEAVKAMLDRSEPVFLIDVRSAAEVEETGKLRGAVWLDLQTLESAPPEIPRDRDVIVYCSCPNEASAARAVMLLRHRGITRVRPLQGGYEAWRDLGYPLDSAGPAAAR